METVRAFVGCLLDLTTTRRVTDLQRALRKRVEAAGWRASWVPPPNLHITMKFVGDVDAGLVAPLGDALAVVARRHAAMRLAVGGVGAFPERGAPRVLFAQLGEGHERLAALACDIEQAFHELGLPKESRPFHAHVTLARVKHAPHEGPRLADLAPTGLEADCGTGAITEVTLYRSDLLRTGAEYHVLARHPLTGTSLRDGGPDRCSDRE
jgi:2'-5' RNA ligase